MESEFVERPVLRGRQRSGLLDALVEKITATKENGRAVDITENYARQASAHPALGRALATRGVMGSLHVCKVGERLIAWMD
jgi:hypothetical protein